MEEWWKKKIIRANKLRKQKRIEQELQTVKKEITILDREIKDAGE